jgi:alpha-L-fucosidase
VAGLSELADWMELCAEGIHGTRPFRDGAEGPSGGVVDGIGEEGVAWTPADHRFTRRGAIVYVFQMASPGDGHAVTHALGPRGPRRVGAAARRPGRSPRTILSVGMGTAVRVVLLSGVG